MSTSPRFGRLIGVLMGGALVVAACAADGDSEPVLDSGGAAAGACLEGSTDCNDTGVAPGPPDLPPGDSSSSGTDDPNEKRAWSDPDDVRARARGILGVAEPELEADIRISRRGDEQYALTDDYEVGRLTVELDAGDDGVYRVVSVTAELPDGPETFTEDA